MIKQFNAAEFNEAVQNSDKPLIVDFYADWCVPCKMMAPILSQVESENKDSIIFGKINIDENTDIALEYRVLSIPTLLFIKNGEVAGRIEGAVAKSVVDQKIEKYLKS